MTRKVMIFETRVWVSRENISFHLKSISHEQWRVEICLVSPNLKFMIFLRLSKKNETKPWNVNFFMYLTKNFRISPSNCGILKNRDTFYKILGLNLRRIILPLKKPTTLPHQYCFSNCLSLANNYCKMSIYLRDCSLLNVKPYKSHFHV